MFLSFILPSSISHILPSSFPFTSPYPTPISLLHPSLKLLFPFLIYCDFTLLLTTPLSTALSTDDERQRRIEFQSEARDAAGGSSSSFGVGPGDWRDRERERTRDRDRDRERRDRDRDRERGRREVSTGKEKSTTVDSEKDGSQEPELKTTHQEQAAIRVCFLSLSKNDSRFELLSEP